MAHSSSAHAQAAEISRLKADNHRLRNELAAERAFRRGLPHAASCPAFNQASGACACHRAQAAPAG